MRKNAIALWFLVFIFLAPLAAAVIFYLNPGWLPHSFTNSGELIDPPFLLKNISLKIKKDQNHLLPSLQRHWILIYYRPHDCDDVCQFNLYKMRQVNLALGKNSDRLIRLVVSTSQNSATDSALLTTYPGTVMASSNTTLLKENYFYLTDPMGNVIMRYNSDVRPNNLLKDIERLLKISQIG